VSLISAQNAEEIQEYTLDNGLKVYLCVDKSASDVFGYVVTKAGAKDDPVDQEGIAHYLEHMMFKGNQKIGTINWEKEKVLIDETYALYEKLKATTDKKEELKIQNKIHEITKEATQYACQNEIDKILKDIGSTGLNANTSQDRTVYHNSFPSFQLENWLKIYSDRFINPVFRGFQTELEVVFEEKNEDLDNRNAMKYEAFNAKIYEGHEYARTVLGRVSHIKKPSLVSMKKYYDKYYVPNNMCLVLTGNFDSEKARPLIKSYFGRWEAKELAKEVVKPVADFKGHEDLTVKMGYSRSGSIVYRTVPAKNDDEITLDFISQLLSNSTDTGLLNDLTLNKKVGSAYAYNSSRNDHGVFTIAYSPKMRTEVMLENYKNTGKYEPVYESFKSTEKLMFAQLDKILNGDFEDWKVDAIKRNLIKSFKLRMENNSSRGVMIGDVFQKGQSLEDFLRYPEKVEAINREEILRVAKKYLGDNYLSLYAYEGKPKQRKIEKPSYGAIESATGNVSEYAKAIFERKGTEAVADYIDFQKDFKEETIRDGVELYFANNPHNDVFSLDIKYGVGNHDMPNLEYASVLMNYAGTLKRDMKSLKEEFAKISCNYSIYSTDDNLVVSIYGDEKYLDEALKLFTELLLIPKLDEDKLELLVNSKIGGRRYEKENISAISSALRQYVIYGEKSSYLDRKPIKDLNELVVSKLVGVYQDATNYAVEMHYCGAKNYEEVKSTIVENLNFKSDLKPKSAHFVKEKQKVANEDIFFVHDSDAVQSSIFLFVNGEIFNIDDFANMLAFNQYFSGGFSGIVAQEIREKRSLTYGAGASYGFDEPGKEGYLAGSTKTQADKTVEAVTVFKDIIKNMPLKADRINNVKTYLSLSSMTSKPGFRSITPSVSKWKELGVNEDLNHMLVEKFKTLDFSNIEGFYNEKVAGKPIAICIVGNKSKVDTKALKKMGKVKYISKSKLFSK